MTWIHFDAGQFLHHEGRVEALMDVEFSCLGDPLADLGALRMRDTSLDKSVINFHAVRFALLTAMLSAGARADPQPNSIWRSGRHGR